MGISFAARRLTARKKTSMFINTACQLLVNACDKPPLFLFFFEEPSWAGLKRVWGEEFSFLGNCCAPKLSLAIAPSLHTVKNIYLQK